VASRQGRRLLPKTVLRSDPVPGLALKAVKQFSQVVRLDQIRWIEQEKRQLIRQVISGIRAWHCTALCSIWFQMQYLHRRSM